MLAHQSAQMEMEMHSEMQSAIAFSFPHSVKTIQMRSPLIILIAINLLTVVLINLKQNYACIVLNKTEPPKKMPLP